MSAGAGGSLAMRAAPLAPDRSEDGGSGASPGEEYALGVTCFLDGRRNGWTADLSYLALDDSFSDRSDVRLRVQRDLLVPVERMRGLGRVRKRAERRSSGERRCRSGRCCGANGAHRAVAQRLLTGRLNPIPGCCIALTRLLGAIA